LVSKLYYNRDWEKNVTYWFSRFCSHYNSVIDAGANIGFFSLVAAKSNPRAVIHAFEPNPLNFLRLQKNIALNSLEQRIFSHQSALGNVDGEISFYLPHDDRISDVSSVYRTHAMSFNDFMHREIKVPTVALDKFCEQHKVIPRIIKIDVELYELQVMAGMQSILSSVRPFVFCEIFNDAVKRRMNPALDSELEMGYTAKVQAFLERVGYYPYSIIAEGIIRVDNLTLSNLSSMYLLLPVKLKEPFYLSAQADMVLEELRRG